MLNSLKLTGYWKLPDVKEWQRCGELTFSADTNIKLELLGSFGHEEYDGDFEYPAVHGFSADGKKITLLECSGVRSSAIPGITTSTIYAKYIIIGDYISEKTEIKIDLAAVHYLYLDEWLNISGFETAKPDNPKERAVFSSYIKYQQPPPVTLYESETEEILIWFSARAPIISSDVKMLSITQKAYFNIKYSTSAEFDAVLYEINQLRNFLAFGLSRTVVPTEIEFRTKNLAGQEKKLQIIYQEPVLLEKIQRNIFDYTTLFSFTHISENPKLVVSNWLSKYSTLQPVFDRYFDCIYNPTMFPVNHFLNLTFAIETYHRRTSTTTSFPVEDYENLKGILRSALPDNPDYKQWFNNKFDHANEPSLRKRIKDTCDEFEEILLEFEQNLPDFIRKVVDSRNYYVHYAEKSKKTAIPESQLTEYNETLAIILQLCLLKELGFDKEGMREAVKRSQYNWGKLRKN